MSHNVGRKTQKDWEESYYNLEQRYLSLQKDVQRKEKEASLAAVALRKKRPVHAEEGTASQPPYDALHSQSLNTSVALPPRPTSAPHPTMAASAKKVNPVASSSASQRPRVRPSGSPTERKSGAPPPPQHDVQVADPRLVWGAEKTVEHFVQVNQLYQATEQLKAKLEDATNLNKIQQHEIAGLRQTVSTCQGRSEELTVQLHQAVRERDLCAQKLQVSEHATRQVEDAIQTQITEKERLRSALEGQLQDLRSRLLVSTDGNDGLSRDVRGLLSELKEKASVVAGLQSRLALSETNLSSQASTNQSLLVELKSLNDQLVGERKRTLNIMREAQVASMSKERVVELEQHIDELVKQRTAMEREHLKMLEDFVRVSRDATARAHEDVRDELDHYRASAAHWEKVSQLMYHDVMERTASHLACREESDEAKRARDEAALACKALRDELRLANAKLNIVWPTHRTDAAEMDPEKITRTFQRLTGSAHTAVGGRALSRSAAYDGTDMAPPDPDDVIAELEQANAALVAELEAQTMANELLTERLRNQHEALDSERRGHADERGALEDQLELGHRLLVRREDRVEFLEEQVRRLRGDAVVPNLSLDAIGDSENVFELFVGQLISPEGPSGATDDFPTLFCTVDFMVHETVATRTVRGWSGFVDTTMAFRVSMDALLWHYMSTRGIMVQLHRVFDEDDTCRTIAEGYAPVWEIVQGHIEDARPVLRGVVKLFALSDGHHVASLEFALTARVPFSQHFKNFAKGADFNALLLRGAHEGASWRRASHEGEYNVSAAPQLSVSHPTSQASVGPSVSVPKVVVSTRPHALEAISSLCVWIDSIMLKFNIDNLPRLSCYFAIPSLEKDVWIPPPSVPTYDWAVKSLHSFPISSMREVFRLLRDPLAFFLFDESNPNAAHYWATWATDIGPALTCVGQPITLTLPLVSFEGVPVGDAVVRIEALPLTSSAQQTVRATAAPPPRTLDEELLDDQFGPPVVAMPAPTPTANMA